MHADELLIARGDDARPLLALVAVLRLLQDELHAGLHVPVLCATRKREEGAQKGWMGGRSERGTPEGDTV